MPYADPDARRACHRRSDKARRARVLAYRKRRRLEALWASYGGELGYLIAMQERDARTYRVSNTLLRFEPKFLDDKTARLRWVA